MTNLKTRQNELNNREVKKQIADLLLHASPRKRTGNEERYFFLVTKIAPRTARTSEVWVNQRGLSVPDAPEVNATTVEIRALFSEACGQDARLFFHTVRSHQQIERGERARGWE